MTLGKLLKTYRERRGLSQGDVAKQLKLTTPQYISSIERGKVSPSIRALRVLIRMYGVPVSRVLNAYKYESRAKNKIKLNRLKSQLEK
jgi:transcriptional regulator with XRE-family HTH domain